MDHLRIGRSLRALRQRRGLTQAQLAEAAEVSQSLVSLIERGHLETVALRTIQRVFAVLDTRLDAQVSWRGGGLDRLLDEAHLALVMRRADQLRAGGWTVAVEATYSVFGERGSIDVLGARPLARAVVVEEVKTDLTSIEKLGRKTDEKVRLVRARLCRDRFGFEPLAVGRILVLPDTDMARRQVARLAPVLDVMFPARTREVRAWLRRPSGDLAGILFVAISNRRGATGDQRGRKRVRLPKLDVAERGTAALRLGRRGIRRYRHGGWYPRLIQGGSGRNATRIGKPANCPAISERSSLNSGVALHSTEPWTTCIATTSSNTIGGPTTSGSSTILTRPTRAPTRSVATGSR